LPGVRETEHRTRDRPDDDDERGDDEGPRRADRVRGPRRGVPEPVAESGPPLLAEVAPRLRGALMLHAAGFGTAFRGGLQAFRTVDARLHSTTGSRDRAVYRAVRSPGRCVVRFLTKFSSGSHARLNPE